MIYPFYTKFFLFITKKIFFTAGYCNKLIREKTKEKQFKIKNAKDANSKLHFNFKLFFEALNLLHKEKISSYKKLIGSENFKFFKKNLSPQKIQNLKKNFEEELARYYLIQNAYHLMNINYIDKEMTLKISSKSLKFNKKLIIFNCGGRVSITIDDEEYYLENAYEINLHFPNYHIEHFYLNMPDKPCSLVEIANFQFEIIKNIIYMKNYRLEDVVLVGYSLGGLVSIKIVEQMSVDKFFYGQKLKAYFNIASFFDIVDLLRSARPISKSMTFPYMALNYFAEFITKKSDKKFLENWKISCQTLLQNKDFIKYSFVCNLEYDEYIPNQCSFMNNFFENNQNLDSNHYENIYFFCYENKNSSKVNHINCKNLFVINAMSKILLNSNENLYFDQFANSNIFSNNIIKELKIS